jgi:CubicO group peptidase (beta-lactamase class C family)
MYDMDAIARLLDEALASGLGSAAAVSVGDAGVERFRHVAGHTRRFPDLGEPITDKTLFDVASLTKPMATVAIAMALEAGGRLDLAAPVRAYVPEAATTATVRQLLGHAAGCAAHVEFFRRLRAERPADPRARLIDLAAREPCDPPGVRAVYSDLGYIVLGALLEAAGGARLDALFAEHVARPLGLTARYGPVTGAVATELDERGLVCGRVHDENAYEGGGMFGHAGLFASLDDVATFAAAMVASPSHFFDDAPVAGASWRLGWDTPTGVSAAGDKWPRQRAVGHMGFTGTSIWLDLPRRRWVVLLTNRVHPTRFAGTAERIKALRRAVGDLVAAQ